MAKLNPLFVAAIAFLLIIPSVVSEKIEAKEFVNDYAKVINAEGKQELDAILKQIFDSGTAQYSIVTVNSLEGKAIESYALDLVQGKLGDTEKNNGLLLLISVEDRQYRFEVGRGIEYILNDAKIGRIGRTYLVPNLQNNSYGKGIIESSLAIKSILLGENDSEYYVPDSVVYSPPNIEMIYAIIFLIFFGMNILFIFARNRNSKNRYFNAALGAAILFGGRGRGGFGGSGGFGGFGGGGFGGGGAGGRF